MNIARVFWVLRVMWCCVFSLLAAHAQWASTGGMFGTPPTPVNDGGLAAAAVYALLAIAWRPGSIE